MENRFFERPILNSPYEYPKEHWELDAQGQPTQKVIQSRRRVSFLTPIPKPRKRKTKDTQQRIVFDEGLGLSTEAQQYNTSQMINELRREVDVWRGLPEHANWHVTPETKRLLTYWRHHDFSGVRPFFCQLEAVETAIWLTEVAPKVGKRGGFFSEYLADANAATNPDLMRLALKLATGAGNNDGHGDADRLADAQRQPLPGQ